MEWKKNMEHEMETVLNIASDTDYGYMVIVQTRCPGNGQKVGFLLVKIPLQRSMFPMISAL